MPIQNKKFVPTGPIPGENYTSDTKNYPWHRPPEINDLDTAVEAIMKQLATRETSYSLLTVLQAGVPVVTAADIFLTNGIGAGKWTPDIALLLAGPTAHIMKIMADDYGIQYDMGIDEDAPPTIEFLKAKSEIDPKRAVNIAENVAGQVDSFKAKAEQQMGKQMGGFAGMEKPEGMAHEANPMDQQEDMSSGEELS